MGFSGSFRDILGRFWVNQEFLQGIKTGGGFGHNFSLGHGGRWDGESGREKRSIMSKKIF